MPPIPASEASHCSAKVNATHNARKQRLYKLYVKLTTHLCHVHPRLIHAQPLAGPEALQDARYGAAGLRQGLISAYLSLWPACNIIQMQSCMRA